MRSNKKRIRIDYAPLNLAVSVENLNPAVPAMQVYNAANGEFEPDRSVEHSVFWPQIIANASDGSWRNQFANSILTQMKWFVDGVDIVTLADWQNLYEIDESDSNYRGAITIKRNVLPTERFSLHFEGVITDPRLGTVQTIITDPIILSTEDASEDAFALSIGDDQIIQYNPFKDKLFLYEYKVAHGLITASAAAKTAATDENAYLRTIPVTLFQGENVITTGYAIKLFRVTGPNTFVELLPGDAEVIDITPTAITLDLRLVTKSDYMVRAVIADSARISPQVQFSVNRVYQSYNCRPSNGTSINPGDVMRYDKAMVDSEGNIVECPESIIKIIWKTDSASIAEQVHNEGEKTVFTIAKTGIGRNYDDDWLDIYTETGIKEQHHFAADANGNPYVDENGNKFIFN